MGLRLSKIRVGGRIAFMLAIVTLIGQTAWGRGYLAAVGPKPFRFESPRSEQNSANLPRLGENDNVTGKDDSNADSNRPYNSPVVVNNPNPVQVGPTLEQRLSPWSATAAGNVDWRSAIAYSASQSAGMSPVGSASANDMLVVTPQMLVNYFKPSATSTNGAGTTILVPVGFSPPGVTPTPPSSQAIYRSP
jgi:hypothetical protein